MGRHTNVKTESRFIAITVMAALGLWLADAFLDSFVFHNVPFWGALLTQVSPDDLVDRLAGILAVAIAGICFSRFWQRQQRLRTALLESEKLTQNLFAEAPLPYQSLDVTGRILNVSHLWLDTLGYSTDEVIGRYFCEFLTPLYAGMFPEKFAKFRAEGNVTALEVDLVKKDGTIITASFNGRVVYDEQGKFIRTHCLFVDITERKEIELKLREQSEKFRGIFDESVAAIYIFDQEKNFLDSNQAGLDLLGYSREELLGLSIPDVDTDPVVVLPAHQQLLAGDRIINYEHRLVRKDGSVITVLNNSRPLTDSHGTVVGMQSTIVDITERKRAESTLAEQRRRLNDIIKGTNVGTWEFNIATGETVISERWAEMLGYTRENLSPITMEKWNALTHPDDLQASNEALRQHFEGERNYYECELRMRHKNGDWVWILDRGRVHTWSDDGEPLLMSGTHQDITERKQTEEALQTFLSRQEAILDAVPNIIMEVDLNKVYSWGNQAGFEFFGEDVLGREAAFYFEGEQKTYTNVQPLFGGSESVFYVESWQRRKDGQKRLLAWWCRVLKDSSGNVTGALSSALDITERKRADEEMRKLAAVVRHSKELVNLSTLDGKMIFLNEAGGDMLGIQPKDIAEASILDVIPDHLMQLVKNELLPTLIRGDTWQGELQYRNLITGALVDVYATTFPLKDTSTGEVQFIANVSLDITEQRAAADELARSEIKYRTLFESAQDAIFLMKDYLFVDCNSTTCEMFGCTREQILGRPPDQFSPEMQPDGNRSKDKALEKMNEAMAGRPQFFEWTHANLNGTCFDAEVRLNGIRISGEQYILAVVRDITERKLSQKALERSLSLQRATLESTADGILVVDRASKVSSFNQRFLEMWRIPEFLAALKDDEKLLKYIVDQLKDPQRFVERVKLLYANPDSQSYDTIEFKDGRVFERYSQPQQVGDEVVGRVWSFRDLTERKRVEMELARLATATEQAAEAIVMTDLEGQIEYVNPAFEKITGYRRGETIGKNMRTMSSSEHDDDFHNELWRVLREGQVWTGRLRSCRKDGSIYEEECSISPIRDQNGVIVSYVAVKRDVTQEVEFENRLRQSQKLEAVGLLAAGIAHDFNNLLAGIKGFAELLTLDGEAGPKVGGYAEEILKAANRAADLTAQLLAFARKGRFLSVTVNVNEVIDEVKAILKHSIDRRIEIKTDCRAERPCVSGDPSQIQSALLNLAINARDAMPDGGELKFETENVHLDDGFCQLHSLDLGAGDYLAISVTDTGVGMDEEVMAHIFDPFFTTKEQGQGTGLGLAGVYGCLKNHHGSVEVTSQPGNGSTFRLSFPVAVGDHQQAIASEFRLKLTGQERLLLVEDEEVVRNLAVNILTNAGYRVTACASGSEAVTLYRDNTAEFDLVLLDMMMPGMHGKDVFAAMRLLNQNVCALLMSGYANSDVQELLDLGIKGFISKPFRSKQLLQKIRDTLDARTPTMVTHSQPQ
jgi:two-component system cell cycle sensor histidine kinase/response regulator CckA